MSAYQVFEIVENALGVDLLGREEQVGQAADDDGDLGYVAHPGVARVAGPLEQRVAVARSRVHRYAQEQQVNHRNDQLLNEPSLHKKQKKTKTHTNR